MMCSLFCIVSIEGPVVPALCTFDNCVVVSMFVNVGGGVCVFVCVLL